MPSRAADESRRSGSRGPGIFSSRSSSVQSGFARHERERVDQLAQVVRRDVRGHAHRDARRAVREQVREARRQDRPAPRCAPSKFGTKSTVSRSMSRSISSASAREARLGVAVGGRRVAVDRAEVALAVDQRVAQREVLGHAHHRVVDRAVAVRVVVLEHLADDAGATSSRARVESSPSSLHRVEDAAVDGLQAVAHVGQRAADDHRHRVVEERAPDLVLDVHRRRVGSGAPLAAGRRLGRLRAAPADLPVVVRQTSRFCTLSAFCSMNSRRGSTSSPISVLNDVVGLDRVLDAHLEQRARAPGSSWCRRAAPGSSRRGPCSAGSRGPCSPSSSTRSSSRIGVARSPRARRRRASDAVRRGADLARCAAQSSRSRWQSGSARSSASSAVR